MNPPDKLAQFIRLTREPLPASRKRYLPGSRADIAVPMREIMQSNGDTEADTGRAPFALDDGLKNGETDALGHKSYPVKLRMGQRNGVPRTGVVWMAKMANINY
jgi:hypothetical protein